MYSEVDWDNTQLNYTEWVDLVWACQSTSAFYFPAAVRIKGCFKIWFGSCSLKSNCGSCAGSLSPGWGLVVLPRTSCCRVEWLSQTMDMRGHSNAWETVVFVVMQRKLCSSPERGPSIDLERSIDQGLDFVGRINASVKSEIQVRLVKNCSTLVLGSKWGSGCQGDWWPCHTWILPGEIRPRGFTTERWRCLDSLLWQGDQNPAELILWGWKSSQPREEQSPILSPHSQSWSPWASLWGAPQCTSRAPCRVAAVLGSFFVFYFFLALPFPI